RRKFCMRVGLLHTIYESFSAARAATGDGPCWVTDESGEIYHISVKVGKSLMSLLDLVMRLGSQFCRYSGLGAKVHQVWNRLRRSPQSCQTSFFCDSYPHTTPLMRPIRVRLAGASVVH